MDLPKILISILNWNNAPVTIRCVHSIWQHVCYPPDRYKIVIIDNASTDGSYAALGRAFPGLDVVQAPVNAGFAAGHFLAYEKEKENGFELLWILNNDLCVNASSLPALVKAYQTHGEGVFGSISVNAENQIEFGGLQEIFAYGEVPVYTHDIYYGKPLSSLKDPKTYWTSNIYGFSMVLPFSMIRRYGYMSHDFFMYYEEIEYCLRLLLWHKIKSYIVQDSVVMHETSSSFRKGNRLKYVKDYYTSRNAYLFAAKVHKYKKRSLLKKDIKKFWRIFYLFVPRSVLFWCNSRFIEQYYQTLGKFHFYIDRKGKTIKPEDYI